ncbi:MAG: LPS assembly protein LptD [Pseudomonadota bacterium]
MAALPKRHSLKVALLLSPATATNAIAGGVAGDDVFDSKFALSFGSRFASNVNREWDRQSFERTFVPPKKALVRNEATAPQKKTQAGVSNEPRKINQDDRSVQSLSIAMASVDARVFAHAQPSPLEQTNTTATSQTGETSSEDEETVLFEADFVMRENDEAPIIATGNVTAYFGERLLKADRLIYDPTTDIVTADGNVTIVDETNETAFAERIQLTGDLRDGIASNFGALLAENARVAAESAVREQGAKTRFRKAAYTACNVCNDEGERKIPTWRVRALKIVRDEERQVVRFNHAFLQLKGVPVLYSPYLQGPDPSVERQSGFLTPRVNTDSRIGFNAELPYYFAISNTQDATFFPRYTSFDGVLWQGEYRKRDDNAYNVFNGGIIDFENFEDDPDSPEIRWHAFAKGVREFGDNLEVGYDLERVSDDFYLRRYNILRRGDLRKELDTTQANRLSTTAYINYSDDVQTLRADTFWFQELRARSENFDSLLPFVLPRIDYRRRGLDFAGGKGTAFANVAVLHRDVGLESRRVTAGFNWQAEKVLRSGHRFRAFAEIRGDLFSYDDINEGIETNNGAPLSGFETGVTADLQARFAPTIGGEWSYPLIRHSDAATFVIEPRVQLIASLSGLNDADIVNEDSRSIEFDYAGLFLTNKVTGYDAFEDGQRANVGLSASMTTTLGVNVSAELGQQFRVQETAAFTPDRQPDAELALPNGVGGTRSDIVGSLNVSYKNFIGAESRFRFGDGFGSLNRLDALAFMNVWRFNARATYTRLADDDPTNGIVPIEELSPNFSFRLTRNWSTRFRWRENLTTGRLTQQVFGITYQDACSLFSFGYARDLTRDRTLPPNNQFTFRFTLKTLVE